MKICLGGPSVLFLNLIRSFQRKAKGDLGHLELRKDMAEESDIGIRAANKTLDTGGPIAT